jgi:hypothetical protein
VAESIQDMCALCGHSYSRTPIFEWHIARLVVKDIKKTNITMRLHSVQNIDTVLGSIVNTSRRAYVINSREQESFLWLQRISTPISKS